MTFVGIMASLTILSFISFLCINIHNLLRNSLIWLIRLGWLLVGTVFYAGSLYAEPVFNFTIHPQASVLYHEIAEVNDYIVALDKYKKNDNRWRPEKFLQQQGQLTRYTIELPKHYVEEDVFSYYQQQIPTYAEALFICDKRQCGESNNWANDHFNVKQLYGIDNTQSYAAYRLAQEQLDGDIYITIYTVRRGNRRLYTQLEVLSP